MATIVIGQPVPADPDSADVAPLFLQMFGANPNNKALLDTDRTQAFKNRPPTPGMRAQVLSALAAGKLRVPDDFPNFWKAGYPVTFRLQRFPDDPWTEQLTGKTHKGVRYTQELDFTEAISPTNHSDSTRTDSKTWLRSQASGLTVDAKADPVPGPYYGNGSDGIPWACRYTLRFTGRTVSCAVSLTSTSYSYLNGTPVSQAKSLDLDEFRRGSGMVFFWTGTYFAPGQPIGIVRSLGLILSGLLGFSD